MEMKYDNVSVTAFIMWQGKALLVQRTAGEDFLPNYWEQVGGKVEADESREEAVIREVKEEAGIEVKLTRSYNQFEYTHDDGRFMCEYAYICELTEEPVVTLSSEHQNYQWVMPQELDKVDLITDAMREVVRAGFKEAGL